MPFTISHAIYAIPLRHIKPKYFSITGLILGSMSPDFEYFLRLEPYQSIGHSIEGLFVQAIPISVILALFFHFIIKIPFSTHLTSKFSINNRVFQLLNYSELRTTASWLIFLFSVILGFITHIFLDGFTHQHGFFVSLFPILKEQLLLGFPIYKLLQYALSVLGIILLASTLISHITKSKVVKNTQYEVSSQDKRIYWAIVILVMVTLTMAKLLFSDSNNILGIIVVAPITGTIFGIMVSSLLWQVKKRSIVN